MPRRANMTTRKALAAATVAIVLGTVAGLSAGAGAAQVESAQVRAPRTGSEYTGRTEERQRLNLHIVGRRIEVFAFRFRWCDGVVTSTSLEDIAVRLRRGDAGYRFGVNAFSIVSYADERPDQNARVAVSGRFSSTARSAVGRVRVRTTRCDTRDVEFRARLVRR